MIATCCGKRADRCRCTDNHTGIALQDLCACGRTYGDHELAELPNATTREWATQVPKCPGVADHFRPAKP